MAARQSLAAAADTLLRSGARDRLRPLLEADFRTLITLIVSFGLCYGALMGTFCGVRGDHSLQILYSALKVPLLLLVTFGLSLPGFFVLNTLLGVRNDLVHALKALLAAQAGMTVILTSFAPFTLLWYASNADYNQAILFNAAMFAAATLASQRLLRRYYGPLLARDRRHRILLRVWLVTYGFVGIQMGWVLRPFIGAPWAATHFFREGAWTNAYEALFRLF
jgi:hypothetical protein